MITRFFLVFLLLQTIFIIFTLSESFKVYGANTPENDAIINFEDLVHEYLNCFIEKHLLEGRLKNNHLTEKIMQKI